MFLGNNICIYARGDDGSHAILSMRVSLGRRLLTRARGIVSQEVGMECKIRMDTAVDRIIGTSDDRVKQYHLRSVVGY